MINEAQYGFKNRFKIFELLRRFFNPYATEVYNGKVILSGEHWTRAQSLVAKRDLHYGGLGSEGANKSG